MAQASKFNGVANTIHLGLENICKWYRKTDDMDMYFVCLGEFFLLNSSAASTDSNYIALDPNYKLAYTKDKWDTQYFEDGIAHLENLVSAYLPLCELV